jgi:integrase
MKIDDIGWEHLEPYLKKARGQGEKSLLGHKSRFKAIKPFFEGREFNAQNFSIFLSEAEKSGKSPSYQNNCLKLIKHMAHYLGTQEFDDFRYVDEVVTEPEYILTPLEIDKLAEVSMVYKRFKNRRAKHKALIYFLGNVGSRIDETIHLEWTDLVAFPVAMVHFRKEITKTKKERWCPIPKWLYQLLIDLPRDNQYIFSKIEASNFRADLTSRCIKCKIHRVTPHSFRDSSINNKLAYGMPLEEVTAYHGHSTTNTTYKYYIKIKAQQLAQSLIFCDPAFKNDQTYETMIDAVQIAVEKIINPRLSNYSLNKEGGAFKLEVSKKN